MPILESRYQYVKVWRPTGTRYAEAEVYDEIFRRAVDPQRTVVSITQVSNAARTAVEQALLAYMLEFHATEGIPSEVVVRNSMLIELAVGLNKVTATVVVPQESQL